MVKEQSKTVPVSNSDAPLAFVQEVACIDLTVDITNAALEVVRQQIEGAAWNAAKVLSDKLLLEEEESQKAAAGKVIQASPDRMTSIALTRPRCVMSPA